MTGGEALARMIQAFHGGPMFGMGGFQLLPFYDAARRLGLRHHLINDERAGVFAADAYAKITGRVGLADATLGPGATNLVTGLVEALNAGSPLVVLTGDTNRDHSWKNMTQESRQLDILRPAVKEVIRIEAIHRIPELMRRAFAVATTGRPGPVVVDVPEDICHGTHPFEDDGFTGDPRYEAAPALRCRPDADSIERAAALLAEAERPLVLAGGGVHISQAAETLTEFARTLDVPVAHTMSGKGAIPCTDPLNAGLFGRYDRIANALIAESDLLLVVGCKLGEIATKRYTVPPANKTIIHLDILPEEIGRTLTPALPLWGDAREGLRDLLDVLRDGAAAIRARRANHTASVPQRMAAWRESVAERLESDEIPVSMARLMTEINRALPEDGILVSDMTQVGYFARSGFPVYAPRTHLTPGYQGALGCGLPIAMGAQVGNPDKKVVAISGDGGFLFNVQELATMKQHQIGVVAVVFDDGAYGNVKRSQQQQFGGHVIASELVNPDFVRLAEVFGIGGLRATSPEALAGALREALATAGPVLIEVPVGQMPGTWGLPPAPAGRRWWT